MMNQTHRPWYKAYFYGLLSRYILVYAQPKDDPRFVVLSGTIHYERDIQKFFDELHDRCASSTRVIILYYSALWKPMVDLATFLGLREKTAEANWISPEDIASILLLSDFDTVLQDRKVICPVYIPLVSNFINRYVAPLPFFRLFCMVNILIARPLKKKKDKKPSVSVIVPARNESGNIKNIIRRLPRMGPDDELIFVEGHSKDDTWAVIQAVQKEYGKTICIKSAQQEGIGKGDAIRKGLAMASKEILMTLDADLTVPPESLSVFYRAIVEDKGEFINGSRLVYPMEKRSMQFLNMVANRFFATAFSYLLGQRFKDTLCGTKVISRENYIMLAANRKYFGDFDPFGDFDLIFGSVRLCLKIVEIPVRYSERLYGTTNIKRWKHGAVLFRMLIYASKKIKFI
ncbi:MAG: glycosyltransferase family 2 protein [Candidatus Omnitrophica bacterium]|nr:glycosyltransferase family 2 protein [Candidatus Omnitrophota bacterium]